MYSKIYERNIKLIGTESQNKLHNSNIIILGVGGVGGYVAECLARIGILNITIVDGDVVDITNINRQIIATKDTINMKKVDLIKERLGQINSEIQVNAIFDRINNQNIDSFDLKKYDFIVDAIDSIEDKFALIEFAYKNNLKIISSMGAGNRISVPKICIKDIHKTSYDKLARLVRQFCVKNGIKKLDVAIDESNQISTSNGVGSLVYYPMNMGSIISAHIINKIIGE